MIRNEFLCLLRLLIGRDESQAEISAATVAYEKLTPEGIELLWEAMNWSEGEQDLMTVLVRFCRTRRRAPSLGEFQGAFKEHIRLYGMLMSPEERTSLEQLLTRGTKFAEFRQVRPTKPNESTPPVKQDQFFRVQQIPPGGPQPKPIQQQKPKPVVRPELPQVSKPMSPEVLPTVARG